MGTEIMTVAFVVVVIGGLGSFWGVVLAALLVGVVRGITIHFVPGGRRGLDVRADVPGADVPPARPARRAHRALRMSIDCVNKKYRPLWIGAVGAGRCCRSCCGRIGLTLDTATVVVILAMAAMGLNLLVGYTGLVSFGHSAWFGIGGYAAALAQLHWFKGQIVLPLLFSIVVHRRCWRWSSGFLILRRRGVYFSLLTLALCALTFAIAFRWTGAHRRRGRAGRHRARRHRPRSTSTTTSTYYVVVALIGFAVLFVLLRVVRSPFGHVLVAIRENEQRATLPGLRHRPLQARRLRAVGLRHRAGRRAAGVPASPRGSAESTTVAFSGELLAMVVIGGMRSFLGPALGALFYLLFRELFSIWTDNWLLWFGLIFVGFVIFSPTGSGRHLGHSCSAAGGRRRRRARR